jgi:hypothetical protein
MSEKSHRAPREPEKEPDREYAVGPEGAGQMAEVLAEAI